MGEIVDFKDRAGKYYKFTRSETIGLVISIIVIAFIISFKNWGTTTFDLKAGLSNLFNAILIVALSIIIHDAGQRLWALAIGYRTEFKMWSFGLMIALVLAFVSNGSLWLIVPGGFMLHHIAGHRLGWFRYGINYFGQAMVALAGPLSNFTLIILLKILYALAPNPLIQKAIVFNAVYIITSMMPIPPLDGSKIYFGSRMLYAFALPAIIIASIMMITNVPVFLALVLSFLVGIVLWIVYYVSFERKVWTGPK